MNKSIKRDKLQQNGFRIFTTNILLSNNVFRFFCLQTRCYESIVVCWFIERPCIHLLYYTCNNFIKILHYNDE